MSTQPTTLLVLTGAVGTKLNAANAGVGFKNPDGSTNVIGVAQMRMPWRKEGSL